MRDTMAMVSSKERDFGFGRASTKKNRCFKSTPGGHRKVALRRALGLPVAAAASLLCAATHAQVPVRVALQEGQMLADANGAAVTGVFNPATNGLGQLAVIATLDSGAHALWLNGAVGFVGSTSNMLTVANPRSVGFSDMGGFVYAPVMNGNESVLWRDTGVLFKVGDAAPGSVIGQTLQRLLLPKMLPGGTIYFLADVGNGHPDFFYRSDGTVAGTTVMLQTTDVVSGAAEALSSVGGRSAGPAFYDVSNDGMQYVLAVTLETPNHDEAVVVNGAIQARQGISTGDGDSWVSFHEAAINDAGDVLVSGSTNGVNNEVIAVNGSVAIREGDVIDGVTLATDAVAEAISVNDDGYAAHYWSHGGGATLFFACDVKKLADSSKSLLSVGDTVQLEGGDSAEIKSIDATFSNGPGLDLATGINLFVRVGLDEGAGPLATIIQVQGNCCGNGVKDSNEECDDGNTADNDGCSALCKTETMGTGGAGGGGGGGGAGGGSGRPAVTGGCDCTMATGFGVIGGHRYGRWPVWLTLSWLALGVAFVRRRGVTRCA